MRPPIPGHHAEACQVEHVQHARRIGLFDERALRLEQQIVQQDGLSEIDQGTTHTRSPNECGCRSRNQHLPGQRIVGNQCRRARGPPRPDVPIVPPTPVGTRVRPGTRFIALYMMDARFGLATARTGSLRWRVAVQPRRGIAVWDGLASTTRPTGRLDRRLTASSGAVLADTYWLILEWISTPTRRGSAHHSRPAVVPKWSGLCEVPQILLRQLTRTDQ